MLATLISKSALTSFIAGESVTWFGNTDRVCPDLCKEYFSLKEQQWESKVLAWCETAPTEILAKHDYRKWDSPQCIKDIQKWLKEKERLAVYLNPCNKNAPNKSDTTVDILLYDEKHSNFHINGVKKPSKHGWVTRKFEELRNRYYSSQE